MSDNSYHFKIGSFHCLAIHDYQSTYAASRLFTNAPTECLEQVLREHHLESGLRSPYPCLFIDTGDHRVLIDTGMGRGVHPERGPFEGRLLTVLEANEIKPDDIDTVILTHGHADHIGGCVNEEGRPVFANARHIMWKEEWDFWTGEPSLSPLTMPEVVKGSLIDAAQEKLPPLEKQLDLIDREEEIVSGIFTVEAPGHTPGHMAVAVASGDEQLLYISDTVLHPLHLEFPGWHTDFYDLDLEEAARSKQRIFDRAATESLLVMAFHFDPFPGLGHVEKRGKGWQWQPMEASG